MPAGANKSGCLSNFLFTTCATEVKSFTVVFRFVFRCADIHGHSADRIFGFVVFRRLFLLDRLRPAQLDDLGKNADRDFFGGACTDVHASRSPHLLQPFSAFATLFWKAAVADLQRWRRGGDSNPRYPFRYARFRGECVQPLCHLSGFGRGNAQDNHK
jgi:hypothetical protein